MIQVFEVNGTGNLLDVNGQGVIGAAASPLFFPTHLDPAKFSYQNVVYPSAAFPMDQSVSTGVSRLSAAISALPATDPFVLIGTSQGAIVCSNVYDMIRFSTLTARSPYFLGGYMFGNPRRQAGFFTGTSDPGGDGIMHYNLLAGCETRWHEFAVPGDAACTNDYSTVQGQVATTLFSLANSGWDGAQQALIDLFTNPIWTVISMFNAVRDLFYDVTTGPHTQYGTHTPFTGDARSCMALALDYISALAA